MTKLENNRIKLFNRIFNLYWFLGIIMTLGFVGYLSQTSPKILGRYISNIFGAIPYIGNLLFAYLKGLNIIDINVFVQNVFKPIITFDATYFALVFIVFQLAILGLKRYTIKHDTSMLTVFIILLIITSLWLRAGNFLYLTQHVSTTIPESFRSGLRWYLFAELLLFCLIIYGLHHEGNFTINITHLKQQADNFIKVGLKVSAVLVIVLSGFYFTSQTVINNFKQELHVSYTIDFTPNQDGYIVLKVPDKVSKPLSYLGISLPEAIDENTLISQLGMKELDVGSMVNNAVDNTIDSFTYDSVEKRFGQALLGLVLMTVIYGTHYVSRHFKLKNSIESLEMILLLLFIVKVGQPLGLVLTIFSSLAFLGALLRFGFMIYDEHALKKLKEMISKKQA